MKAFKELIDQKVERLFLIVTPPLCEEMLLEIDISIGIVFAQNPDIMTIITTDEEDILTPCIYYDNIPLITQPWLSYNYRMEMLMISDEIYEHDIQYYEITEVEAFKNIINQRVISVEFVGIQDISTPFGVKLEFENDFILSTPIPDGNTIETTYFNKNENTSNFNNSDIIENNELFHLDIQTQN